METKNWDNVGLGRGRYIKIPRQALESLFLSEDGQTPITDPNFNIASGFFTAALTDILDRASNPSTVTLSIGKGDRFMTIQSTGTRPWSSRLVLEAQDQFRAPPVDPIALSLDGSVWKRLFSDTNHSFNTVVVDIVETGATFHFFGDDVSATVNVSARAGVEIKIPHPTQLTFNMNDIRQTLPVLVDPTAFTTLSAPSHPDLKGFASFTFDYKGLITHSILFGRPNTKHP